MKTFYRTLVSVVCILICGTGAAIAAFQVNGPTTVCPQGTYQYSASGASFLTAVYKWYVADTYNGPILSQGGSNSSSFNITYNSRNVGTAWVRVEAQDGGNHILDSYVFQVTKQLPIPVKPNGGTVLFCGANESVVVNSSPYIPYTNLSDIASCNFHCSYNWQAPGGWNFQSGVNSPSNNVGLGSSSNTLVSPGSVANGNNGTLTLSALYSECGYDVNTSNSAVIWVGTPSVSNGQVNGSSYSGGTLVVPSGYANLSVQIDGGGSANWYITNGSGSLYPSGNYCSVSWSGFVRVVVDASNRCGGGGSWTFYLTTQQGYYGYRVAPNPAKDQVSLMLDSEDMAGDLIQNVAVYDDKSKLWLSTGKDELKTKYKGKKAIDLAVKNLPRGKYFLHVKVGDEIQKHQIILE